MEWNAMECDAMECSAIQHLGRDELEQSLVPTEQHAELGDEEPVARTHARTHAHAHTRTHAHARAHTHTHTAAVTSVR